MDPVSLASYARSLIDIAEKKEGQEKRQLYLEAAENYLQAGKNSTGNEKQYYLNESRKLYELSQKINAEENKEEGPNRIKKPNRKFSDVAGLEKVKEEIMIKIIEPLKHPEIFRHFGKKAGGGILMYGPPGCGKSLIAEATAGEADVAFFNVKASDIKSKYVGQAEQNLAKLFDQARKEKACIIFFDEFEALGGERSRMTRPMKGVVSQLLTEMDGVGNKEQNILIIGATNEPWNIDTALRREGRFGTTIFIPPPDKVSRREIIRLNMKNRPVEENVNFERIADKTEMFSGADLKSLCEKATDIPLTECLKFKIRRNVNTLDFEQAMHCMKPTTGAWFRNAIKNLKEIGEQGSFPEIMDFEKMVVTHPCRVGA